MWILHQAFAATVMACQTYCQMFPDGNRSLGHPKVYRVLVSARAMFAGRFCFS